MNTIMRTILVASLTCALGSGAALAAKPSNPPADSGRDVIGDAQAICDQFPGDELGAACDIVFKSNGGTIADGRTCEDGDGLIEFDNGYVDYTGRNCDKNEAAVVRLASSAVLSIDDVVSRGKEQQRATAGGYLCSYEDKWNELLAIGKLIPGVDVDLGADASDLADDVTGMDGYCDYLDTL